MGTQAQIRIFKDDIIKSSYTLTNGSASDIGNDLIDVIKNSSITELNYIFEKLPYSHDMDCTSYYDFSLIYNKMEKYLAELYIDESRDRNKDFNNYLDCNKCGFKYDYTYFINLNTNKIQIYYLDDNLIGEFQLDNIPDNWEDLIVDIETLEENLDEE